MTMKISSLLFFTFLLLLTASGFAQTRTEELEQQRSEHQKRLAPAKNTTKSFYGQGQKEQDSR
jgi:outer membrane lipoprotein-sorting protein